MTNEEAREILIRIAPMPRRGDGKSITQSLVMEAIARAIKALGQQPKMGHWIWKSGKMIDYCSCSVCKKGQWEIEWNYCPNCGAKMEVEEE